MSLDYIDPSTPRPIDWAGPIFPEPMLYRLAPLWLFLLLLAVLGLLFYRQRLYDARSDGRRAPSIIYNEVRKAINQALYATGPATIPAGQRVLDIMKLYLGPLLAFSGELRGPLGKLEKAVAGKAEHGEHHKSHSKGEVKHIPVTVSSAGGGESVTTDSLVQVIGPAQVITVGDAAHKEEGHGHHHHDEVMSTNDQTAAVRYALERLHEFWTITTVEPRLREIHQALSIREPKGPRIGGRDPVRGIEPRRRPEPSRDRPRL